MRGFFFPPLFLVVNRKKQEGRANSYSNKKRGECRGEGSEGKMAVPGKGS